MTTQVTATNVPVNSLIELKSTDIKYANYAQRVIDVTHATALSYVDTNDLPAIELAHIEEVGDVIVDGYHRIASRRIRMEREMKLKGHETDTDETQVKVERRNLSPDELQALDAAFNQSTIPAIINVYDTDEAIIEAAFEANEKHGLAANKVTRTNRALFMYHAAIDNAVDKAPSIRQIAKVAGISHVALWEALKKEKKALEESKIIASNEAPSQEEIDVENIGKAASKLVKAVIGFDEAIVSIEGKVLQAYQLHLTIEDEDKEAMEYIGTLLILASQMETGKLSDTKLLQRLEKALHPKGAKPPTKESETPTEESEAPTE